jgi:peroxiredoxin
VSDPPEDDGAESPPPGLQRLDPDAAAQRARGEAPGESPAGGEALRESPPRPLVDPRPYRWVLGILGLLVVIAIAIYGFATHGVRGTGVAPGRRLYLFAAPLALSNLDGDPNPHPTCSPSRHDRRALNLCLIAAQRPLVVDFFVTGASSCERQVDALQTLSRRYPSVAFAAVAVNGGHRATAIVARAHHWTIPVAYDRDGTVQQLYGVVACPMVEMAARGGIVRTRLIGYQWQTEAELSPYVQSLASGGS